MGQPKQLLQVNGETLIHRAARLALATAPQTLFVVLAEPADAIATALQALPHQVCINPDPIAGMGSSLHAAAPGASPFDHVLVLVCDQPALSESHLQALLAGAKLARSGCAATALQGKPGVPAVVPGAWFNDLPTRGDGGFRARLRALPDEALKLLAGDALALDIDTAEDLVQARALGLIDA